MKPVSTCIEIDLMIAQLEEKLPAWSERYAEQQFIQMLAAALDYIALSADPNARLYCMMRTGCLRTGSGEEPWLRRYGPRVS